ncbi:LPS translocon maturation chaperone LptM [Microbulbifer discodermiae]|uniref:LPS translocon maturation chaperone LptM n=1 Tax=Microbulbifer sp. 2201CG32-9 TaxID=3232309 RepID=UPI00345C2337
MPHPVSSALAVILVTAALSACGQKGPLYLPQDAAVPAQPAGSSPSPGAPAASAPQPGGEQQPTQDETDPEDTRQNAEDREPVIEK